MNQNILLTGATGFIGSSLCLSLAKYHTLHTPLRAEVGDLLPSTNWTPFCAKANVVIHLAARAYIMKYETVDSSAEYRKVNTLGTLNLARQAAATGVRRFIFLSSVKVNGESNRDGRPFTADDIKVPTDPYGLSKYEAEQGLREISQETGMEVAIIRPPIVYGPGVKANFLSMMNWLHRGIPLPLGAIHNKRSIVAIDNLVDMITTCIDHPAAANQTFLVSDGECLSTTELLQRLSKALGKPACLLPVPQKLLETTLTLLGKGDIAQRLCGSLQVDITKSRELLCWNPPFSVDEALQKTAQAYLASKQ